jgi:predicted heme/steroid binding protein
VLTLAFSEFGRRVAENASQIRGTNSQHVVVMDGTVVDVTNATVLDGVTITAGEANGADQQGGLDARQIQSIYQHQERWSKTSNRLRRGDVNDPTWTPCDYSSSYGTDSCE